MANVLLVRSSFRGLGAQASLRTHRGDGLSRGHNVLRSLLVQVSIERCLVGDVLTLQWTPAAISRAKETAIPANEADDPLILDEAVGLGPGRAMKHTAVMVRVSRKKIPPFLNTDVSAISEDMEIMDDISASRASVGVVWA